MSFRVSKPHPPSFPRGRLHSDEFIHLHRRRRLSRPISRKYDDHVITQIATGLFGVREETIQRCPFVEFKYAQGAKPGSWRSSAGR